MFEDMGIQIPLYGDYTVVTPSIDRLASMGTTFTYNYVTQASCSPSRSSFFTGLFPHQNGQFMLPNQWGGKLHDGTPTFIQMLKSAGYYTGITYKIHVDPEESIPFDVHFDYDRYRRDSSNTKSGSMTTSYFMEFLEIRPTDRPFYFQAQMSDTHRGFPRETEEGQNKHRVRIDYPESPYKILNCDDVEPLPVWGPDFIMDSILKEDVATYYYDIQRVDCAIGMFIYLLKEKDLLDNSVIIFTTDHGPAFCRIKVTVYELGVRVPLIFVWPGVMPPGTRSEALTSWIDFAPSFLEMAGLETPAYMPGRSLREAVENPSTWRDYVCSEFTAHIHHNNYFPTRAIRDEHFKLIHNLEAGNVPGGLTSDSPPDARFLKNLPEGHVSGEIFRRHNNPPQFELYDLQEYPWEWYNLVDDPQYADKLQELKKRLLHWREWTVDPTLDEKYLRLLTNHFMTKQEEINAFIRDNPNVNIWQSDVMNSHGDMSVFRREWSDVEKELVRAKQRNF